ncbi:trypsin-like peptidase domain-containing protein [Pseudomonas sp. MWU16-30317]|uniref:trypsin-like serine peptidase n=1 Tax=Pseudomonas sp. MWU16-30317 TaxID=2878095 RepID=UPI001CFB8E21|nr:trypsin-like peptidase domain-containing protein [Pseudomonas sp. MWU16-30317]
MNLHRYRAAIGLSLTLTLTAPAVIADPPAPRFLDNADGLNTLWNGVGKLETSASGCTAFLIDTRSADHAQTPAYILTAGHCVDKSPSSVILDQPIEGTVVFNYFKDTAETRTSVALSQVKWSAMHGADLAIIELDSTLDQLTEAGINPLALTTKPVDGSEMVILGIPGAETLQWAGCKSEWAGTLIEAPWVWRHQVKNNCRGVTQGVSGAPAIDPAGNRVFAVIGTTTGGSSADSRQNAPFEVVDGVAHWRDVTNYGSTVEHLPACFAEGRFDSTRQGCGLQPSFSVIPDADQPPLQDMKMRRDERGELIAPSWNYRFSISTPHYRYKAVGDAQECESAVGYSQALDAQDAVIDDILPAQTGVHALCILGVESDQQRSWPGLLRNSVTHAVQLHDPSPARSPRISHEWSDDGKLLVLTYVSQPHTTTLKLKRGLAGEVDCSDEEGYVFFDHNIAMVRGLDEPPLQLCAYGLDSNGALSELKVHSIPEA